jgi:TetR/AcrR family tetracycline transcriptional repressor
MAGAGLSREKVLEAAVRLVDEQGLAALSMRRLGAALGVEAMSLYNHVHDKGDLLDGIHEAILAEMKLPRTQSDWRRGARALAHAFRDVLVAHPNALPIFASRPAVTPGSLQYIERALAVLDGTPGLRKADLLHAFQTLVAFVIGHTSLHHAPAEAARAPALDPARLPVLARAMAAHDPDKEFAFGLECILRGLASRAG